MSSPKESSFSQVIAFANCAGAAREESASPLKLGEHLRKELPQFGHVLAVGLSEVLMGHSSTRWNSALSDLVDFEKGFAKTSSDRFYFPHLDSSLHNHPDAMQEKWRGKEASIRIAQAMKNGDTVEQGTAVLTYANPKKIYGQLLRPSGQYPFDNQEDNPQLYRGTRDTEPRSVLIVRGIKLENGVEVDLAFCQLETKSTEARTASRKTLDHTDGSKHRMEQIKRLGEIIFDRSHERPVILMGDFNCRPGAKELLTLGNQFGFKQVFPEDTPLTSSYRKNKISKHSTLKRSAKIPQSKLTEEKQGWPFTHLTHRILIDHAFVHGFDMEKYDFELHVMPLPSEGKDDRISDHRPIVLRVMF